MSTTTDTAAPPATRAPGGRRALAAGLALGVAGASLVLVAAGRTWAEGRVAVDSGRQTAHTLSVDGGDVTAIPGALALVGLAALVAVFAVRRAGRLLVSALLALSGAVAALTAVLGAFDGEALDEAAVAAAGLSDAHATGVTHTAWPWVAAAGGALLLASGLLALLRGRDWPAMSSRYEAPGGGGSARRAARPAATERPDEIWRALDRGEDPTDR
ncbi:TIGR02234 family membrane protein [Streptomyces capparidis]